VTDSSVKPLDLAALDVLTGGAFTASNSGDRTARLRDWLAGQPTLEQLQAVFNEMSSKDKGAAKVLREKLDELRRTKDQDALIVEWATKGEALRDAARINLADAMGWQRDAAKAGAPLSREPLAGLKTALAERVKAIEDLQHQTQVQREAAVLLAQRIEVLSTKPWQDALALRDGLQADLDRWNAQAQALAADAQWPSVDAKFAPALQTSAQQVQAVWTAFSAALTLTEAAAADAAAPLPAVPAWADQVRVARGEVLPQKAAPAPKAPAAGGLDVTRKVKPTADKAVVDQKRMELVLQAEALFKPAAAPKKARVAADAANVGAAQADTAAADVAPVVAQPEAVTEGVAPVADAAPAAALSDLAETAASADVIENTASSEETAASAPAAAVEPFTPSAEAPTAETPATAAAPAEVAATKPVQAAAEARVPAMGGRKLQEALRNLRDQWKKIDKEAAPNPALWKRFDAACNRAHEVVDVWLKEARAQTAAHKAQRLALIEEVKAWSAEHAQGPDWKGVARQLHQFAQRWRDSGHLSEKMFAELQPTWKAVIHAAHEPLEAVQKASLARRHGLIAEAQELGAAPTLRIDAVKALQQRWQEEAHTVVLDRKQEQKLWDAFRQPIDEAFARKTSSREQTQTALTPHDKAVIDASKALESAIAKGDGAQIRSAMQALEQIARGEMPASATPAAPAAEQAAPAADASASAEAPAAQDVNDGASASRADASAEPADGAAADGEGAAQAEAPAPVPAPKAAPRPVVAVRGDDRPGQKRTEVAPAGRGRDGKPGGGKFGDRAGGDKGAGFGRDRDGAGRPSRDGRDGFAPRGPRLGDAAFRAQRFALESAQDALRRLAAQAHGEVLTQLMHAWEKRDASQLPAAQAIGSKLTPSQRTQWAQALASEPKAETVTPLLRLEVAAELPTPAAQMDARRALQLQMLTRRNDPSPQMTWAADAAQVLAGAYDEAAARRLQSALKVLLKR
jgi:ATP-dependent RNA helicase SUPV3L1/SUV3